MQWCRGKDDSQGGLSLSKAETDKSRYRNKVSDRYMKYKYISI